MNRIQFMEELLKQKMKSKFKDKLDSFMICTSQEDLTSIKISASEEKIFESHDYLCFITIIGSVSLRLKHLFFVSGGETKEECIRNGLRTGHNITIVSTRLL